MLPNDGILLVSYNYLKIEIIGSSRIMCPKPGGELAFTSGPMFAGNLTKTTAVTASTRVGFLGV